MKMLEIDTIQFHSEIFHAGKNFGNKIGHLKIDTLKIEINEERTLIHLWYQGRKRELPAMNAVGWELKGDIQIVQPSNDHQAHDITKLTGAQVSTPMGHVFEGPGKGKTGRAGK